MLEIHPRLAWDLSALSPQMARDIWKRRKTVAGKKGLALVSEKDEMIILVAHLLLHRKKKQQNLLHYVDIALAWQKEAWRLGIENTDNREVKELVDLSVAVLVLPDEAPPVSFRRVSFGNSLAHLNT